MEKILEYLDNAYHPLCILLYGSYANGTNNAHSDFDCLLIVQEKSVSHDASFVDGVQLDAFLYTREEIRTLRDCEEVIQVFDARILRDTDGLASALVARINRYIDDNRMSTPQSKAQDRQWLEKMIRRAGRGDAEGNYRLHWALVDSLPIYCSLRDLYYHGPKKTISIIRQNDPDGYVLLARALQQSDCDSLNDWVRHVIA